MSEEPNKNSTKQHTKSEKMSEEVKLFGSWFSPPVKRVEIALKLKGVEYEYIEEDLKNKSPLLLQYNPVHKNVPVLVHNGKAIAESIVILEYIDEAFEGPPILPKDPHQRALARFWAKFFKEKCGDVLWNACWSGGEEREKQMKEVEAALEILEGEIKGKRFFGGGNIGLVDIYIVGSFVFWIPTILQENAGLHNLTKEKFPNMWKWSEELCEESTVKECLPEKEKIVWGFKKVLETGSPY